MFAIILDTVDELGIGVFGFTIGFEVTMFAYGSSGTGVAVGFSSFRLSNRRLKGWANETDFSFLCLASHFYLI